MRTKQICVTVLFLVLSFSLSAQQRSPGAAARSSETSRFDAAFRGRPAAREDDTSLSRHNPKLNRRPRPREVG
jgi:hypothetical protein